MSFDVEFCDPETGAVCELDQPHQMSGGIVWVGGTTRLELNFTYNYSRVLLPHNWHVKDNLNDQIASDCIAELERVIAELGDDVVPDNYWAATEGNAKRALQYLLVMAKARPDARISVI